jgi:hypothetical protein
MTFKDELIIFINECKLKQTLNIRYDPCRFIQKKFVVYHTNGTIDISGQRFYESDILF